MPALPAATAAVRAGVRGLLTDRLADGALSPGELVLVGCSGGADSLALAAQTAFCAPRLGLRAGLVTVDHGMQPGSAEQADRVAREAHALGLDPVLIERGEGSGADPALLFDADAGPARPVNAGRTAGPHLAPPEAHDPAGGGREARARGLRHRAFAAAIAATGARAILLGHTMDDQAEGVLLALARGSGIRAMAGMEPERGLLWRPLLGVRRTQTVQCCRELGLRAWDDPTNAPDGPWRREDGSPLPRAAVRAHALPALASALGADPVPALARTAALARVDADHLDHLADAALTGLAHGPDTAAAAEALDVEIAGLLELPAAILGRVIRALLVEAGAPTGAVSSRHVAAVASLLTDWHGQGPIMVPGGIAVRRACGRLRLVRLQDSRSPSGQ